MKRMDSIGLSDRRDERDDDDQRRKCTHDAAHGQEKEIQHHQKNDGAFDMDLD